MPDQLEYIRDLLKSCFIPELKQDLDSIPIQSEHFSEYHLVLEQQLPLLYDFVQQHENWIFLNDEKDTQEIYACLIVLLCEITSSDAIFKLTKAEDILKNANRLLRQRIRMDNAVDDIIFAHYQSKLQKDCWKRQLGAVHSFVRFLEIRYIEDKLTSKMSTRWLTFSLSVGLTVRESHEPIYKQMGIRIFHLMLYYAEHDAMQKLNIHGVIYDDVFKDVHFMNSVVATAETWSCLAKCLEHFENIDSFNWCQVDDMMDILMRNISLAPDSLTSICLLKFITKLCCFFAINRDEIEAKYNADLSVPEVLQQCRTVCQQNSSYTILRWAKSILNMLIIESYKLMQSANICRQMLQEMHRCYMVSILPVAPQIIEPHLLTFLDKFTAVLMEVIVVQNREQSVVQLVKSVLNTFYMQLHTPYCEENQKLLHTRLAFQRLLQLDLFM